MKREEPIDIIQQFSQMDTMLENMAKLVANYFNSIMKGGVPYDLARDLTIRWYERMLDNI